MNKIYQAAKYIKTSCSDDESQHRDSVANQNKLIDRFLRANPEITVVIERVDDGYSGLFYNRPAFADNDNIDSTQMDGIDRTFFLVKAIFSEQYSRDISVKTRSSLESKRRQSKYVGSVPIYGYLRSGCNKCKLAQDPNTYDIV